MSLTITTADRGNKDTILLSYVGTGVALPETAVTLADLTAVIPDNAPILDIFERVDISGETSFITRSEEYYYGGCLNSLLISPYLIFEGTFTTDPNQIEPLPYFYELRYEHISNSRTPYKDLKIYDQTNTEIPRQYYKTFVEASYRTPSVYTGVGNTFGPFILQASQIDLAKARAALGENIWGEVYGTSPIEEHLVWERFNEELIRPPYDVVNDINIPSGHLSRIDDGRYTKDTFMEFYLDYDGHWGQVLLSGAVEYTDKLGEVHIFGVPISGEFDITPKTIRELQSEKYLDGDITFPSDTAYRISLLLPEFLVHTDTLWVQYNKTVGYELSGEFISQYTPNYREIINPTLLMREGIEYSIGADGREFEPDGNFEMRWGTHSRYYVKRNRSYDIHLRMSPSGDRQAWQVEVNKGHFKSGDTIYETHRIVDAEGHGKDWYHGSAGILSDEGYHLRKIIKERAEILNTRTLRVRHTPIWFWSGPRGTSRNASYGYLINETDTAVFDTGENANPTNPWPRYIPPNLIDWHSSSSRFYPANPALLPDYSYGVNIYRDGVLLPNSLVETWDYWNGLIIFKEPLNQGSLYEVTYLTKMNRAILVSLNLNPLLPEMLYNPAAIFEVSR